MDLILILSKFSGQIGPKPNVLSFIQQLDRSDRSGRVDGKRPKFQLTWLTNIITTNKFIRMKIQPVMFGRFDLIDLIY
jgi:hypothetical protein